MKRKSTILLSGAAILVLLAGALSLPPAQLFFQGNRVRYLANANQFNQALLEYEKLAESRPAIATRLPDFETSVTLRAMHYYAETRLPQTPVEREDYTELMTTLLARPALAPLARRMNLRVTSRRDGANTPTMEAAHTILDSDGFDLDALWWAVISHQPESSPMDLPPELAHWRKTVEQYFLDPNRDDPVQVGRLSQLKGLLALADGNWAEASYHFERYQRLSPADVSLTPREALAHGLALLRSGRSEAAIALLEPFTHRDNPVPLALDLLAEAYLTAHSYPWAAQTIDTIRNQQADPNREKAILDAVFGDLSDQDYPIEAICARLTEPGAYAGNTDLWKWLDAIVDDPKQRQAVDGAAMALTRHDGLPPHDNALLLEYALERSNSKLAELLVSAVHQPELKIAFRRIAQWYPHRNLPQATELPRLVTPLGLLLTHTTTKRIDLELPAGSEAIVLRIKGYPSQGVWPILHLDLGDLGRQTWYVIDRSRSGRPLVFVLSRPLTQTRQVEVVLSMLNGDPSGREDRNVVITDLSVF